TAALPLFALVLTAACAAEPVRLHALRDAPAGSPAEATFAKLENAVAIANDFLASPAAATFPAESAHIEIDYSDLVVVYQGEGRKLLRIETASWGDPRVWFGDGTYSTRQGFLSRSRVGQHATAQNAYDADFFSWPAEAMAAGLIRLAAEQQILTEPLWQEDWTPDGRPREGSRVDWVTEDFRAWLATTRSQ
ncbi:MAG TPA: hypothetical protein VGC54_13475, partial [Planctomycetota bacterium]